MAGLTDKQQGLMMLLIFILPPFITWTALGFPTGRAELGILASAFISGILAFTKEVLGWKETVKPEG